jgi:TonB-linked SusC/RagA family outer membrane protein
MLMRKSLFLLLSLLCLAIGQVFAQSRTLTGKVTSSDDGQPVIGATVIVKGTSVGAVTNPEGVFSIKLPDGTTAGVLTFKSVGMQPMEVKIGASNTINVVMQLDVTRLTETVVTANAIRRDPGSIGYSAPTVKSGDLTKGQSASALNALAGKVAGVNITSTAGAPGSSSRVVLRGGSSINGNNQALMVVDGVPIDNSSITGGGSIGNGRDGTNPNNLSSVDYGNRGNDINPEDIESITVLKGPAAAALYGSRASNGALIITTKSGKKMGDNKKQEVTFNSAVTFSNILKLPEFQNEYGQGAGNVFDARENGSWGTKFDGKMQGWGQTINGVQLQKPYSPLKDNIKKFFELGKAVQNNLSLSGAGEKTSYYLSVNSLNSNGIMPGNNDNFNKYGVRFNGSAQLSNKFYTSISVNYNKINGDLVQGGQGAGSVYNNVLQTPRDIPLNEMGDLSNPYYSMGGVFDKEGNEAYGFYGAYTKSPYFILKNFINKNIVDRVTGNVSIGYKPTEWLDVVERVGADVYSDRRTYKYSKFRYIPLDNTSGNYSKSDYINSNGKYGEDNYNLSEITHDLMITAKKQFNKDFKASLMVGNNIRQRQFTTLRAYTNTAGLVIPGWYNLDNSNGPVLSYNEYSNRRLVGLYSELNLDYKNMLFLGATARNDWSSTLPIGANSFFYPSVNASFVFSELLSGTKASNIINYGKLRASWAQVGNDADPYLLRTYYSKTDITSGFGGTIFPLNSIPGYTLGNRIGNSGLRPEITTAMEVGTEIGFLNDRIFVDFSYYRNKSKDQILNTPISSATGFSSKALNTGLVENKGVELSLRGTPIRTASGFSLELYGTYTKNQNTVVSIADGVSQVIVGGFSGMNIVAAVGQPYGTFYAQDIQRDAQGRVIVSKETGLPLLTDAVYLGSYNPKYMASVGANLSYKGFSFSVLFDTKQGGKFYSRTKDIMDFVGTAPETVVGGREDHIWPGSVYDDGTGKLVENTDAKFNPQLYWGDAIPAGQHVLDASYIRLREMSLSYRFPQSLLRRTPFGSASVGLFGNNLALWTAKENVYADPEVNSGGAGNEQGFDFTAQPAVRNFGFNLKVTF